jgi:6-phosphogluconolactonase (cycloisomerase 2 family)
LNGSGPNKRQNISHPHQVVIHEEYQELFVADLGSDIVRRFKKASDGSWKLSGHIGFELGGGPRHVAFYGMLYLFWLRFLLPGLMIFFFFFLFTGGDLFTLLELTNKVVRHRLPPLPEFPVFVKSVPTMSNLPPTPNDFVAAEILIPPTNSSFPTPYLYVSNRDDPSPEGDIISIFLIDDDGLELVAEVRSGLKHLRGMAFGGLDDKFLVAGGAMGGGVKVFERVDGGANLRLVAGNEFVEAPTGFLWL